MIWKEVFHHNISTTNCAQAKKTVIGFSFIPPEVVSLAQQLAADLYFQVLMYLSPKIFHVTQANFSDGIVKHVRQGEFDVYPLHSSSINDNFISSVHYSFIRA